MGNKAKGAERVTSETKRRIDNAYNARLKRGVINHYGGCCRACGYTGDALQLHHVNGDGAAHRAAIGIRGTSGRNMYTWLKRHNYPDYPVLEVLCASCHVEVHAQERGRRRCAT